MGGLDDSWPGRFPEMTSPIYRTAVFDKMAGLLFDKDKVPWRFETMAEVFNPGGIVER